MSEEKATELERDCNDSLKVIHDLYDLYSHHRNIEAYIFQLKAQIAELKAKLEDEKKLRIDYQGVIYQLCSIADRSAGRTAYPQKGVTISSVAADIQRQLLTLRTDSAAAEEKAFIAGVAEGCSYMDAQDRYPMGMDAKYPTYADYKKSMEGE